jgi:hypothetical protein
VRPAEEKNLSSLEDYICIAQFKPGNLTIVLALLTVPDRRADGVASLAQPEVAAAAFLQLQTRWK